MRSPTPRFRWSGSRGVPRRLGGAFVLGSLLGVAALGASLPPPGVFSTGLGPAAREHLPKDRLYPVPFAPGETLVYEVAWLKIEGGEMTIATTRERTPDGVPVHRIALRAESNEYVSRFYPVRTRYETWVDARDFLPIRFEKHAREGRYESDELEQFDLARRVAVWRDEEHVRATGPVPERFQDIISSFFWLRTQALLPGSSVDVDMYSRGKVYRLRAVVLGREPVETPLGAFTAYKVQPQLREGETDADRNRGKLFLWFSDDDRRLPVMARTVLPIGSVTARLKRVDTGRTAAPAPGD